ncbi:MAG: SDR family oxidoreductase [Actinomycetales bacterium]
MRTADRQDLAGRVVLVTGATSGVGRATAERLVSHGATVVGCARTQRRIDHVRDEVPDLDLQTADVGDPGQRRSLIEHVESRYGRLDALVSAAGIGRYGWFDELSEDDLEDLVRINTLAPLQLTRLCLPLLRQSKGDLVLVGSSITWSPFPPLTAYAASKAGLDALTRGLRRETKRHGVRVHLLQPGPLRTELLSRTAGVEPREDEDAAQQLPAVIPSPEHAARAVIRALTSTRGTTQAVPRAVGVGRLTQLPLVREALDVVLSQAAPVLVRSGHRLIAGMRSA